MLGLFNLFTFKVSYNSGIIHVFLYFHYNNLYMCMQNIYLGGLGESCSDPEFMESSSISTISAASSNILPGEDTSSSLPSKIMLATDLEPAAEGLSMA